MKPSYYCLMQNLPMSEGQLARMADEVAKRVARKGADLASVIWSAEVRGEPAPYAVIMARWTRQGRDREPVEGGTDVAQAEEWTK